MLLFCGALVGGDNIGTVKGIAHLIEVDCPHGRAILDFKVESVRKQGFNESGMKHPQRLRPNALGASDRRRAFLAIVQHNQRGHFLAVAIFSNEDALRAEGDLRPLDSVAHILDREYGLIAIALERELGIDRRRQ
jgi:hypothetical protein